MNKKWKPNMADGVTPRCQFNVIGHQCPRRAASEDGICRAHARAAADIKKRATKKPR